MILISSLSSLINGLSKYTPPGLVLGASAAFLEDGKYFDPWLAEFFGTLLMIFLTFSPGKWIGADSMPLAWASHAVGVVASDYIAGGPHVNPAVSLAMFSLGKCNYTEMYVRMCASMAGGLVAFPLFLFFSESMGWQQLGGPEYSPNDEKDDFSQAFLNEFFAFFCLIVMIYVLNFELNFGKYHYWIKQPMTAIGIRYLIEVFGLTGPAMNPMLGTAWAVFASGKATFPEGSEHYFVYWLAPFAAALVASFGYAVYSGSTFFGSKLPFGPVKAVAKPSAPPMEEKEKKKKGGKKD